MLNLAINKLNEFLANCPFIERLGGIVTPIARPQEVTDGNGNVLARNTEVFPISCNLSANCWNTGKYMALVPDSSKKSVFYWEQIGNVRQGGTKIKGISTTYIGRVRLVAWLNLQRLGLVGNCSYAPSFILAILQEIIGQWRLDNPYENSRFNVTFIEEIKRTPEIFKAYNYSKDIQYFLYPYDYFALDFEVTLNLSTLCIDKIEIQEPIDCITV